MYKLDTGKVVFDASVEMTGFQFQTPSGGRMILGMKGIKLFGSGPFQVPSYTVATAPSAVTAGAGSMIYVTDGNAGDPTLAISDGALWKVASTDLAIAIA